MLANRARRNRRGFTLVEVLIVVVILGILAATVLPQFSASSDEARESSLVTNLQTMRAQIELYKLQHDNTYPGTVTGVTFEDALTKRTNRDGTLNATNGRFGPYIIGLVPVNPFNDDRKVTAVAVPFVFDGTTSGWFFNTLTGEFKANLDNNVTRADGVTKLNTL